MTLSLGKLRRDTAHCWTTNEDRFRHSWIRYSEAYIMRMISHLLRPGLVVLGCWLFSCPAISSICDDRLTVARGNDNVVSTSRKDEVARSLTGGFFAFNLEWADFQQDLWESSNQRVKPAVVDWLRPFAGAVYRYPGGTGSNYLDWRDTIGERTLRPSKTRVDWLGPIRPEFGFDEYLNFVREIDGRAWVVLNIYGDYERELDSLSLARNAADWASYAERQAKAGRPPVVRWELGNELDRGKTLWPPEKYAGVATLVLKSVSERVAGAKFVAMLQDWPAQKAISVSGYNRTVMNGTARVLSEYAHHLYYEGSAWDSVQSRVTLVCRSIDDAHSVGLVNPSFWITEHARGLPSPSANDDWKQSWPKTANIEAGLIAAEAYISATQVPEIQGLFLHSLGTAHGPWPLFNSTRRGSLHPSAVYWSLRVLRDSMLPIALVSRVESRNESKSIGKNDVRAAILTDSTRLRHTVWAVNRAADESVLRLRIPSLAGRKLTATFSSVGDSNREANNYASADRVLPQKVAIALDFDSAGESKLTLPPYSVSALQMHEE